MFLRGIGATLGLPLLEAMLPRRAHAAVAAPKRFAFIYTPNGHYQPTFAPQYVERVFNPFPLTPALEPLTAVKDHISLITGLDRQFAPSTGVHAQCGSCWLTSSAPQEPLDGGFPTNTSLDQLIARKIGQDTMLPSVELSCNDFTDKKETKYFECVSWYSPGYAANTEKNPRAVFQRLFGKPSTQTRGVLDAVMNDAQRLHKTLSHDDQHMLAEYLNSVRDNERRIELAEQMQSKFAAPSLAEPQGVPEKSGDYLRLMAELFVLAFQQDRTRVATLLLAGPNGEIDSATTSFASVVFGRGRLLGSWPLADLDDMVLEEASMFLVGRCGCRMKNANPGWDILLNVDWDKALAAATKTAGTAEPTKVMDKVETVTISANSPPSSL